MFLGAFPIIIRARPLLQLPETFQACVSVSLGHSPAKSPAAHCPVEEVCWGELHKSHRIGRIPHGGAGHIIIAAYQDKKNTAYPVI